MITNLTDLPFSYNNSSQKFQNFEFTIRVTNELNNSYRDIAVVASSAIAAKEYVATKISYPLTCQYI